MGKVTKIEWCDFTFNPWWGCQRVSPGCEHCYAEAFAKRTGHKVWGPEKTTPRRFFGDKHWDEPYKWALAARAAGARRRVFCASMADVFEDRRDLDDARLRLFAMIQDTIDLDWLLLTKRPENMRRLAPEWWADGWPDNVWAGTTTENQEQADKRTRHLREVPARVRFLSVEPMIGPIDPLPLDGISWVIVGGESGPGARPFDVAWARSTIVQCKDAGVACFVKQLGAYPIDNARPSSMTIGRDRIHMTRDAKGGDISQWAPDLAVREFPTVERTLSL